MTALVGAASVSGAGCVPGCVQQEKHGWDPQSCSARGLGVHATWAAFGDAGLGLDVCIYTNDFFDRVDVVNAQMLDLDDSPRCLYNHFALLPEPGASVVTMTLKIECPGETRTFQLNFDVTPAAEDQAVVVTQVAWPP